MTMDIMIRGMSVEVHSELKARAEKNGTSMNHEVNKAIEWWFSDSSYAQVTRDLADAQSELESYKDKLQKVRALLNE